MSNQPVTDICLLTRSTDKRKIPMLPSEFEPAITLSEQPEIHALDRAATWIGNTYLILSL
jgi:hypothetical protein